MELDFSDFNVFEEYASYLIKNSFVHSLTGDGYSVYSIGNDINANELIFTTKYSHTDTLDVWCEYVIYCYGVPISRITLPLNLPIQDKFSLDVLALFKKCSQKVIAQEKMAQKNMFLRTIVDDQCVNEH